MTLLRHTIISRRKIFSMFAAIPAAIGGLLAAKKSFTWPRYVNPPIDPMTLALLTLERPVKFSHRRIRIPLGNVATATNTSSAIEAIIETVQPHEVLHKFPNGHIFLSVYSRDGRMLPYYDCYIIDERDPEPTWASCYLWPTFIARNHPRMFRAANICSGDLGIGPDRWTFEPQESA
jgi:hypothetical protein